MLNAAWKQWPGLNYLCTRRPKDDDGNYTLTQQNMQVYRTISVGECLVLSFYMQVMPLGMSHGPAVHHRLSLRSSPGHIILSTSVVFTDPMKSADRTSFRIQFIQKCIVVFDLMKEMHFIKTLCKDGYTGLCRDSFTKTDVCMSNPSANASEL